MGTFDRYTGGRYADNYEKPHKGFYDDVAEQCFRYTPEGGLLLDIGTGPASLERSLCAYDVGFDIIAVEPSDTVYDAEKEKFDFSYTVKRGSMSDVLDLFSLESLDTIALPRSPHEIAKSMGSRTRFWEELDGLASYLKDGGHVVFADPMYNPVVAHDPGRFSYELDQVKEHNIATIGHNDIIEDMFSPLEVMEKMGSVGFSPLYLQVHDKSDHLRRWGISINQFLVGVFRRI